MSDSIKVSVTGVTAAGDTKSNYEFTQDWFLYGSHLWPNLIQYLPKHQNARRFLEIGSFEGRSSVWIIENMMKPYDELVCIDTWAGGEEHSKLNMGEVERRFDHNIAEATKKAGHIQVVKIKDVSTYGLARQMDWLENPLYMFDFIYVDGSHQAADVLCDAVMAWRVLKDEGVMVFDDYLWGDPRMPLHRPKVAIDAFMNIFAPEMVILHTGYQIAIQKKTPGKF